MRPLDLFSLLKMDRWTDQQTYLPIEMQFYISVMFLGLPDNIQEEKPPFFSTLKITGYRPMDRRTYKPPYRDLKI